MKRFRRPGLALVTAIAISGVVSACGGSSTQGAGSGRLPTTECLTAFADASTRLDAHYAKWGVVGPDDFDQEEAEWRAAFDPLYDECSSAADFMAAGKEHPDVFGVTAAKFVDVMTIQIYCDQQKSRPSCDGIDERY